MLDSRTSPRLGRGKRVLFLGITFLLLWGLAEVASFAILCGLRATVVTPGQMQEERDRVRHAVRRNVRSKNEPGRLMAQMLQAEVVHPYLGFVVDPSRKADVSHNGVSVNEHGLWSRGEFLKERDPGRVVVGIFGGSVAFWFSLQGVDRLTETLREDERFADKEFEFVRMTWGGYKQPQQLVGLHYFLTLGAHFDLIVNLDGFNEVALSTTENLAFGVHEAFPRSWHWRVSETTDPEVRRLMGLVVYARDRRRMLAARFSKAPLRYSFASNLVWKAFDRRAAARVSSTLLRIRKEESALAGETRPFVETGPFHEPASDDEAFDRIVAQWRRASILMHHTCEGLDIPYFHFLQPNQYLPGSKPMGAEERAIAYLEEHPHHATVRAGYPKLIAAGDELAAAGVRFHDLTQVFADVEEPLYIDTCCHLGERGNEILGEVIGQAILSDG